MNNNIRGKYFQAWRDKSITTKFTVGIGLLLFLMMTGALASYLSMLYVRGADDSIKASTEIQRLVLEMDRGMANARHLHSEFFLHYPREGLQKAHEKYAQPSIRTTAKVVATSKKLKALLAKQELFKGPQNIIVDLNLYLSSAQRFALTSIESFELAARLAGPENGLEAKLHETMRALENEIVAIKGLDEIFHQAYDFVELHRITRERHQMQSAFNSINNLQIRLEKVVDADIDILRREKILELFDQFKKYAEMILDTDLEIKSKSNDFTLQEEAVNSVSTALVKMAEEQVQSSYQRIQTAYRLVKSFLLVVSFVGFITAITIAWILNTQITRRVVRLTDSASKLRKGNFEVSIHEDSKDELGELSETFNFMALRIKELIDTLEQKVISRTAELTDSQKRYSHLFEYSLSGVVVYEVIGDGDEFIIRDINQAVEKIEEVSRKDILGKKVTEIFPGVISFGLVDVLKEVWKTGKPAKHPIELYYDGRIQGWRENFVYRLPSGEVVAVYQDKTKEKLAEIQKISIEKQLERSRKMEAIGLLAGGVAHDLNNILAGIVGYPELILQDLPADSKLREPIKAIHESGNRAAAVVADLLTVARGVANEKKVANLNIIVAEYLKSPEALKFKDSFPLIETRMELAIDLHNIACSSVHVKKSIMNLMINAMEAIDGAGVVSIRTFNKEVDALFAAERGLLAGTYVVLEVKDTGSGISAADMERIFEPFYTRKVIGRSGTGLGLAVVWNSMIDHGGSTFVESSSDGTVFSLYFPATMEECTIEAGQVCLLDTYKGNGEKIMVVDDELQLRNLTSQILKMFGYEVTCLSSGEEAIEYLKRETVDLLILDMIMEPGINGRQTFERVLQINSAQKAIVASGYSENEDVVKTMKLGACGFIKKPYSMIDLGKIVKDVLRT